MAEGESIMAHISEFVTLFNGLKNVKANIDDKDQVMLLLRSLPHSYKTVKETLIYGRKRLLFEDVKGNLLSKDKLDKELGSKNKPDGQAFVLVVRGRQQSKDSGQRRSRVRSKSRNRDKQYGYCKKMGHIEAECCMLQNKNKRAAKNDGRGK
ncbi:uncharacterized protein LOC128041018 [Gossypium raimondii]|uniref:uncharacterized protein LOC128041018 n=1 Tax=Gossypium raimondii TaxID=29730 RepID=UPI00227D094C|nr:uncharacterized protein LOC128041018 [Gossypium raimondii]